MPPPAPSSSAPEWREIGRPWPGEAPDWATWVALLDQCGGAFYRFLLVADGPILVTVDRVLRRGAAAEVIHRCRCALSRDPAKTTERIRLLLAAADKAVMRAWPTVPRNIGRAACAGEPHPRRCLLSVEMGRPARGARRGILDAPVRKGHGPPDGSTWPPGKSASVRFGIPAPDRCPCPALQVPGNVLLPGVGLLRLEAPPE